MKLKEVSAKPIWTIGLGGVIITLIACFYLLTLGKKVEQRRFESETDQIIRRIEYRMNQYVNALYLSRAFLLGSKEVDRSEFQTFFEQTKIMQRYPGILGLGFAARVDKKNFSAYTSRLGYEIWPSADQDLYYPITYLEPQNEKNKKALGFDMFSEPVRRSAMIKAVEDNQAVMTGRIQLVQESERNTPGFNIYLPVFSGDSKTVTGFIYAPFQARFLFDTILEGMFPEIELQIFDGTADQAQLLYDRTDAPNFQGEFSRRVVVKWVDQSLTLVFKSESPVSRALGDSTILMVLLSGLLITSVVVAVLISNRKQVKILHDLHASEKLLSAATKDLEIKSEAIENSLNGFDIVSEEGKFIYVNSSYLRMWGYSTPEEVLGTSPVDHCADPQVPVQIITALKEKGSIDIEFKALRKDKSTFDVRMMAYLAHDHEGREIYPTISIDVTAAKVALRKLEESETFLKLVTDSIPSLVSYLDKNEVYRFANKAYEDWFNVSRNEIVGKKLKNVLGESYETAKPRIQAALQGTSQHYRLSLRRDDDNRYLDVSYYPDRDANGVIHGIVILGFDINEMERNREQLQLAMANAQMGSWSIDLKTGKTSGSPELSALFGLEHISGHSGSITQAIAHPDDLQRISVGWREAVANRKPYSDEFRIIRPTDGETRWMLTRGNLILDEKGSPQSLSGITMDITEQKLAEQKLRKALASRDDFLSIASHELKTPLTSLRLQSQLIKRTLVVDPQTIDAERIKSFADLADTQVTRLNRLVDDMMDVSRLQSGHLTMAAETTDLTVLLRDIIVKMTPQFESKGLLPPTLVTSEKSLLGYWDPQRLEQAFTNLITNALRYGNNKPVTLRLSSGDDFAEVSVEDQGIGIKPLDLRRIFEKFERAVNVNEVSGLGLGLFITKSIVDASGGSIRVASVEGQGSTFTVRLPIIKSES